jgi:hypothetical protein
MAMSADLFGHAFDPLCPGPIPRRGCFGYSGGGGAGAGAAGNKGGGCARFIAKTGIEITGKISTRGLAGLTGNGGNGYNCGQLGYRGGPGGTGADAGVSGSSVGGSAGISTCDCRNNGDSPGGVGGDGGPGAGGGVVLICEGPMGIKISGTIDTRGGGPNGNLNFGSIKLFGVKGTIDVSSATILGGWNDQYGTPLIQENKNWVHVC